MDQALAEDAAILTAIGTVTAFSLLVLLMVVIWLIRLFSIRILGTVEQSATGNVVPADAETREKALAAVIAVSALMDRPESGKRPGSGYD